MASLAHCSLESMSNRDVAAFWSLLPRMLHKRGVKDPDLEGKLTCVIDTTCRRMGNFQYRDLAQISLGIAKTISQVSGDQRRYRADDPRQILRGLLLSESQHLHVFDSIGRSAVDMLDRFDARHLSNLIYSYGLIEYNPDIEGETLFDVFGQAASKILHTFNSHDISNMLLAFVYADAKNPRLFQETGEVILGTSLGDFTGQALANVLWSFAKSGETNPELFEAFGNHIVGRSLDGFWPQHLSNIVWSYATAGVSHPELFKKFGDHVTGLNSLDSFKPQELSNIAWAYATAGVSHPELFNKIGDHVAGLKSLESFNSQDFSNTAWAFATAGESHPELFKSIGDHIQGFVGACASRPFSQDELAQLHQWQLWQHELKSGIEMPQSLQEKCRDAFISASYSESKLQDDVVGELTAAGLDLEEEVLLGSGYRADALVKVGEGRRVAVEVDGPTHFVQRRPTGSTTLKHRQVERLDCIDVVSVPYWEWDELKNSVVKQHYLRKKLGCETA